MTTSGTTVYDPALSALTLQAFERIGLRGTEVTIQHLQKAAVEANLLQVSISNGQPNLWRSELFEIALVEGTANYALPARMIAVQDIYIRTIPNGAGAASSIDRVIYPMSLSDYDAQPNKTIQAPPTAYVVYKTIPTPTITFWQVPDGNGTYTVFARLLSRPETASMVSGTTLDMPYIYLDAYVAGMAHRLARIYAPDKEMIRKADYQEALALAQNTDTQDNVSMVIGPSFGGYYSRR